MPSASIILTRISAGSEEALRFRQHLHDLVGKYHSGKERPKYDLPENTVVLVAKTVNGVSVGSVTLRPLEAQEPGAASLPNGAKMAEVKRMIVLPEHQGTGAASQLLSEVEKIARTELGTEYIVLETLHTLETAKRFYEKNGYQRREVYGLYDAEESQCYEKWL